MPYFCHTSGHNLPFAVGFITWRGKPAALYLGVTTMAKNPQATRAVVPAAPASYGALVPVGHVTSVAPAPLPATPAPALLAAYQAAQAPAPVAPAVATTGKGAATAARWYGGFAQAVTVTPASAKALPPNTVITCNVAANPKRNAHNVFVYPFVGGIKPGATCTWGQFVAALAQTRGGGINQAAAHLAWDASPKRLKGQGWVSVQAPQA